MKKIKNNYKPSALSISNLDIYIPRTTILNFLNKNQNSFNGNILDIGCGNMPYKSILLKNEGTKYTGLDIKSEIYDIVNDKDKIFWDGKTIPIKDNTYDTIICTELLEHTQNADEILSEIFRVLKPDGKVFITVPFIWPVHEAPYDEYRYTPYSLKRIVETKFKSAEIGALGGYNKSLALVISTYLSYHIKNRIKRRLSYIVLKPLIKRLIKTDNSSINVFENRSLFSGLYCIAKKTI